MIHDAKANSLMLTLILAAWEAFDVLLSMSVTWDRFPWQADRQCTCAGGRLS